MPSDLKYSKPIHIIHPRITMMLAIDSFGEIYYSLMYIALTGALYPLEPIWFNSGLILV